VSVHSEPTTFDGEHIPWDETTYSGGLLEDLGNGTIVPGDLAAVVECIRAPGSCTGSLALAAISKRSSRGSTRCDRISGCL
jgi:hypothetical protein